MSRKCKDQKNSTRALLGNCMPTLVSIRRHSNQNRAPETQQNSLHHFSEIKSQSKHRLLRSSILLNKPLNTTKFGQLFDFMDSCPSIRSSPIHRLILRSTFYSEFSKEKPIDEARDHKPEFRM